LLSGAVAAENCVDHSITPEACACRGAVLVRSPVPPQASHSIHAHSKLRVMQSFGNGVRRHGEEHHDQLCLIGKLVLR